MEVLFPTDAVCVFVTLGTVADYEAWWKDRGEDLLRYLCSVRSVTTDENFNTCFDLAKGDQLRDEFQATMERNFKQCAYVWNVRETGAGCAGDCPGYRGREILCLSPRDERRPEKCCPPKDKPKAQESCGLWDWDWEFSEWGPCSKTSCGWQVRVVSCRRCDGQLADEQQCSGKPKPATRRPCNTHYFWQKHGSDCPCNHHENCHFTCHNGCNNEPTLDRHCVDEEAIRPPRRYCGDCDRGGCFGASNNVTLATGVSVPIASVRAGDLVMAASPGQPASAVRVLYSSARSLFPRSETAMLCMAMASIDAGGAAETHTNILVLTHSHLMYSLPRSSRDNASPALVRASSVIAGDTVFVLPPGRANTSTAAAVFRPTRVVSVSKCRDTAFVLLTEGSGDVVVGGVAANSFTDNFVGLQRAAARVFLETPSNALGWAVGESTMVHLLVDAYEALHRGAVSAWGTIRVIMASVTTLGVGMHSRPVHKTTEL